MTVLEIILMSILWKSSGIQQCYLIEIERKTYNFKYLVAIFKEKKSKINYDNIF